MHRLHKHRQPPIGLRTATLVAHDKMMALPLSVAEATAPVTSSCSVKAVGLKAEQGGSPINVLVRAFAFVAAAIGCDRGLEDDLVVVTQARNFVQRAFSLPNCFTRAPPPTRVSSDGCFVCSHQQGFDKDGLVQRCHTAEVSPLSSQSNSLPSASQHSE